MMVVDVSPSIFKNKRLEVDGSLQCHGGLF